jgi:hypothetical protein
MGEMANTPTGKYVGMNVDQFIGGAKSVGSTVYNLGKLVHEGGATAQRVAEKFGAAPVPPDQSGAFSGPNDITRALEPSNSAQSIGKTIADVGQFFIPGQAEAGALAPLGAAIGKAGIAGRAAMEAANAGAVAASQGGDPRLAAALGAAGPPVGAVASKLAPEVVNAMLNGPAKMFRAGANAGRGAVTEGIVSPTLSGIVGQAGKAMDDVGSQIGNVLTRSPKAQAAIIDATSAVDPPIDKAIRALKVLGKDSSATALENLRQGIYSDLKASGVNPTKATPSDIWEVRKQMDMGINHLGAEGTDVSVNKVSKVVRRNLANQLETAVPEVGPLNKRYSDLASLRDSAIERSNASHGFKGVVRDPINWLIGTGGSLMHHPLAAAGGIAAKEALTSPLATTLAGQGLRAAGSPTGVRGAVGLGSALTNRQTYTDENGDTIQLLGAEDRRRKTNELTKAISGQ